MWCARLAHCEYNEPAEALSKGGSFREIDFVPALSAIHYIEYVWYIILWTLSVK